MRDIPKLADETWFDKTLQQMMKFGPIANKIKGFTKDQQRKYVADLLQNWGPLIGASVGALGGAAVSGEDNRMGGAAMGAVLMGLLAYAASNADPKQAAAKREALIEAQTDLDAKAKTLRDEQFVKNYPRWSKVWNTTKDVGGGAVDVGSHVGRNWGKYTGGAVALGAGAGVLDASRHRGLARDNMTSIATSGAARPAAITSALDDTVMHAARLTGANPVDLATKARSFERRLVSGRAPTYWTPANTTKHYEGLAAWLTGQGRQSVRAANPPKGVGGVVAHYLGKLIKSPYTLGKGLVNQGNLLRTLGTGRFR